MSLPLVLVVSRATPSLNAWTGRPRYVYTVEKRRWCRALSDAWFDGKARRDPGVLYWPVPPRERVTLHVERFTPRADGLDWDNAHGGLKVVIDALRHLRLLANDTPAALAHATLAQPVAPAGTPRYWSRLTLTREV